MQNKIRKIKSTARNQLSNAFAEITTHLRNVLNIGFTKYLSKSQKYSYPHTKRVKKNC